MALFDAPKGFSALLDPLPDGAAVTTSPRGDCDVVLGFVETLSEAMSIVPKLTAALADGGVLWVCYPKLTSARAGELSRDVLWKELAQARPAGRRPDRDRRHLVGDAVHPRGVSAASRPTSQSRCVSAH